MICASNSTIGLVSLSEMFSLDITGLAGLILYLIITSSILLAYFIPTFFNNDDHELAL
jgi:hypothetical protein